MPRIDLETYAITLKMELTKSQRQKNEIEILKKRINELYYLQGLDKVEDDIKQLEHVKANIILYKMFGVDIAKKTRKREYVKCRQFFYRYFYRGQITYKYVSKLLAESSTNENIIKANQDHSTVIHAIDEFNNFYQIEPQYKKEYDLFVEKMKEVTVENAS